MNQFEQNLVWAIFDLDNNVELEQKHTTSKGLCVIMITLYTALILDRNSLYFTRFSSS